MALRFNNSWYDDLVYDIHKLYTIHLVFKIQQQLKGVLAQSAGYTLLPVVEADAHCSWTVTLRRGLG